MKGLLVLQLFLVCVCFAEVCESTKPKHAKGKKKTQTKTKTETKTEAKTVLFGIEGSWGPFSFINQTTGKAEGLMYDVVAAVCDECKTECEMVFVGNNFDRCVNLAALTASGVFDRHYDACIAWAPTIPRKNYLAFTAPILTTTPGRFYTLTTTTSINGYADIPGVKVGFREHFWIDIFCPRRNGINIADDDVVVIPTTNGWYDLIDALIDGTVDVIMIPDGHDGTEVLKEVGDAMSCDEGGLSLLHRKDVHFEWFEKCLDGVRSNMILSQLCDKWGVTHRCIGV